MTDLRAPMKSERKKQPLTFWFSESHADHYRKMNRYAGADLIFKNTCKIGDEIRPYTTCTDNINDTEPFDGALERFPDYRKLGSGDYVGTEGSW
jgi:hypothetical protein